MSGYLLDALDLGTNPKGISRVLSSLVPELVGLRAGHVLVACTRAGAGLLPVPEDRLVVVPSRLQSRWEQWELPRLARRLRVQAVYSHREAGALWGAPLVLHVPEDPEVRWARQPTVSFRNLARRRYSRAVMRRALCRAAVVGASTPSVAAHLSAAYGIDDVRVLPLGVDLSRFTPAPHPAEDMVFHLGSADQRDRSDLVVQAYARAVAREPGLPPLVLGGALGEHLRSLVLATAGRCSVADRVRLTGRLDDAALADHYRRALVVLQPASDEGFGLQPLEALACGAPVVVTPAPAVLDVVGDAAVTVRPTAEAFGDQLLRVARDSELRGRLRSAGPVRAARYSWRRSAELVLEALEDAAVSRPAAARGPAR